MAYIHERRKPMFSNLRYCSRCGLPTSEESISYDELQICTACRSSEQKMRINWSEREKLLRQLLERFRGKHKMYDCLCPISGGKDSAFQLYMLTQVYKLKPLAVTFSHNWWSDSGWKNLQRTIETFNVDHIMFTPSRQLVNKCARHSLESIGDACWHCHTGVGSFSLKTALFYEIPLIVWGESAAEGTGKATYDQPVKYNVATQVAESAKVAPRDFAKGDLTARDLEPLMWPRQEELDALGVVQVHMGDYIFWDGERQTEFLREKYGWLEDKVEGTYKCYKSVECRMPGVHDFTRFLKRGMGRTTEHVCQDIRAGILTLEEGYELMRDIDPVEPEILDYYLHITGYSRDEFYAIMDRQRDKLGYLTREEIQAALDDARRRRTEIDSAARAREALK
ncbi:MAG: N-acetyl sugar amidotransferase [Alphaproteobacteria bacterium]|nr:N-acetyl sugar amidotransferase [Alphaproteobacteria bacterium]